MNRRQPILARILIVALRVNVVAILLTNFAIAQTPLRIEPSKPIVCYQKNTSESYHVEPPLNFREWRANRSQRTQTAAFEVQYVNFPADNQARNAFQFAVDIWATQLVSDVPIRIRAQWQSLQSGVLGQAIWGSAYANFDGAQHLNVYYPAALAEKIARKDLNGNTDADIVATFSSNVNWYYGTNGVTPAGKMDLVTIVLHEIAHGLGFVDTYTVDNGQGSVGMNDNGTTLPFVYDLFTVNLPKKSLYSSIASPSTALAAQLTNNNLFYNSPLAEAAFGSLPKIYAPSTFNPGSSISHLDETTFSQPGNANNLMTPQIAFQEAIHNPGVIATSILKDMGWQMTWIDHIDLRDTERKDGQPYPIVATLSSDNGFKTNSVKLNYRKVGDPQFTKLTMTSTGNPDEFQSMLPGTTQNVIYEYYISGEDILSKIFCHPGTTYLQNKEPEQKLIRINVGPDQLLPVINHTPVDYVFEGETEIVINAEVTDNLGIAAVNLEYSIGEGPTLSVPLQQLSPNVNEYSATISLSPSLPSGTLIHYKITASDISQATNISSLPLENTFTVFITGDRQPQQTYINDFNTPSYDFIGTGFSITKPTGFLDNAIHSTHPYKNAQSPLTVANYTFELQIPIIINEENPNIRFDEVVLVEPGEGGSEFGDEDFYDYVIVEGSKDDGLHWIPFEDGYDSRFRSLWLSRYNTSISNHNSLAVANSTFYRDHVIDMTKSGIFKPDDEILIRFRLFADQTTYAWGWTIDNLSIQGPVTGTETEPEDKIYVYPNPAKSVITFHHNASLSNTQLGIFDVHGKKIHTTSTDNSNQTDIDISDFPAGLYFLKANTGEKTIVRKFLKVN